MNDEEVYRCFICQGPERGTPFAIIRGRDTAGLECNDAKICSDHCYGMIKTMRVQLLIKYNIMCEICSKICLMKYNMYFDDNPKSFAVTCSKECYNKTSFEYKCEISSCSKKVTKMYLKFKGRREESKDDLFEVGVCSKTCAENLNNISNNIRDYLLCNRCGVKADKKCNVIINADVSKQSEANSIIFVNCSKKCMKATIQILGSSAESTNESIDSGKCCGYCNTFSPIEKFRVCSRCKKIHYCSRECQKAHWPFHKRHCEKEEASVATEGDKKEEVD